MPSTSALAWKARGRALTVSGLDVFLVEEGAGEPAILLLHGFPTSSYDWVKVWPALARHGRLVAFDFPGYGYSAKPAGYSYSLHEQADVAEGVLRDAGVSRARVVAHDMGTSVLTELLARRARGLLGFEIDRVVLMNGSVHAELAHLTPAQRLLRRPLLGPLFARIANFATYRLQVRRILGRPDALTDHELADQFALLRLNDGHLRLPKIMGYYAERIRFRERWIGALKELDIPALVLWGRRDPVAVPAIAEALARETPGAELVWMEELGHYPQLENPERVSAEILRFLAWTL